jgi:hypothetical protein
MVIAEYEIYYVRQSYSPCVGRCIKCSQQWNKAPEMFYFIVKHFSVQSEKFHMTESFEAVREACVIVFFKRKPEKLTTQWHFVRTLKLRRMFRK